MIRFERRTLPALILIGLGLFGLVSMARTLTRAVGPAGGLDFHPYWYQGHALRQGHNPYAAYLENLTPQPPFSYLDGVTTSGPVLQPGLSTIPTNAAPLALPLFGFSYFSWPVARWLWLLVNLACVPLVPALALQLFPYRASLSRTGVLLVHAAFYAFAATRVALWIGQTSLVVLALMLGAVLLRRTAWPLAGILLGIALSKYSLALPIVLFLLLELRPRSLLVLGTALLVQALGLLVLAVLSASAPLQIVQNYVDLFRTVNASTSQGIQLAALFPPGSPLAAAGVLALSLATFGALAVWWLRVRDGRDAPPADYAALAALALWTLLCAYHGVYDVLLVVLLVPVAVLALAAPLPAAWPLGARPTRLLGLVLAAGLLVVNLPGEVVEVFLAPAAADAWLAWLPRAIVLALLVLLGATLWLLAQPRAAGTRAGT